MFKKISFQKSFLGASSNRFKIIDLFRQPLPFVGQYFPLHPFQPRFHVGQINLLNLSFTHVGVERATVLSRNTPQCSKNNKKSTSPYTMCECSTSYLKIYKKSEARLCYSRRIEQKKACKNEENVECGEKALFSLAFLFSASILNCCRRKKKVRRVE